MSLADARALALPPASITDHALCAETDPDAFFPEGQGASSDKAERVCARCDVVDECRAWARETRQPFGVWGGETQRQRARALREEAAGDAPGKDWPCPSAECGETFDTRRELVDHRRSPAHITPATGHPCPLCGRVYKHPRRRTTHMETVHGITRHRITA